MHLFRRYGLGLVFLLSLSCGGDGDDNKKQKDSGVTDVSTLDTTDSGGGVTCQDLANAPLSPPSACSGSKALIPTLVVPDGFRTQVHQDAAFDGTSIWVSFVGAKEGDAKGQVMVARVGCDGTPEGSFVVNACKSGVHTSSSIAVAGDKVFVTWSYDDRSGKVKTAFQIFDKQGTPLFPKEKTLITKRGGSDLPLQSLVWEPSAYALVESASSSFGVVGVREAPGQGNLWGYAQDIGLDGNLIGETIDLTSTPGSMTKAPRIATNKGHYLALVPEKDASDNYGYVLSSNLVDGTQRFPTTGSGFGAPEVAFVPGEGNKALITTTVVGRQNTFDIITLDVSKTAIAKSDTIPHGREGTSPALAFEESGKGIMFWLSRVGGLRHDLYYTALDWTGQSLLRSDFVKVATASPVGPEIYQMRAIAFGDEKFGLVFPQGNNPSYSTTLTIVDLKK